MNEYKLLLEQNIPYLSKLREIDCENELMNKPEKIANFFREEYDLHKAAEEYGYVIALNSKLIPTAVMEVSHGAANFSILNPREVFIRLLLSGAVNFVLVHNHPSGDLLPSEDDKKTTKKLKDVSKLVGINLVDHIIIGREDYFSFEQSQMLKEDA